MYPSHWPVRWHRLLRQQGGKLEGQPFALPINAWPKLPPEYTPDCLFVSPVDRDNHNNHWQSRRALLACSLQTKRPMESSNLLQLRRQRDEIDLPALLHHMPAMIGYCDPQQRIRFGSKTFLAAINRTQIRWSEERHIRDLIGDQLYSNNRGFIETALQGTAQQFESAVAGTNGGPLRHLQTQLIPDLFEDEVLGCYAILIDITDLHAANKAAQAASIAKSQFLSNMSHEIRTPLNGMLGMAQLLMMPRLTNNERLDYAGVVLSSGKMLMRLLNNILDLSGIEAGNLVLESRLLNPSRIICDATALFVQDARAKGLLIDSDASAASGRYLGDAQRLAQMLSSLVSNAVKFTNQGGFRIEAREVECSARNATLEFSVTDTGIGIAPDQQPLLFQTFSQVDASSTRPGGGTGLGLSIVRRMAELMGGQAGVASAPGTGSRFWFRIPAEKL